MMLPFGEISGHLEGRRDGAVGTHVRFHLEFGFEIGDHRVVSRRSVLNAFDLFWLRLLSPNNLLYIRVCSAEVNYQIAAPSPDIIALTVMHPPAPNTIC